MKKILFLDYLLPSLETKMYRKIIISSFLWSNKPTLFLIFYPQLKKIIVNSTFFLNISVFLQLGDVPPVPRQLHPHHPHHVYLVKFRSLMIRIRIWIIFMACFLNHVVCYIQYPEHLTNNTWSSTKTFYFRLVYLYFPVSGTPWCWLSGGSSWSNTTPR